MADQSMDLDEEPKATPSPDTEGENSLEQFTSPVVTNDNQGSQDPAPAAPAATTPPAPTAAPAKAQLPTWDEAVAGKKPTWDEAVSQHQQGSLLGAFNPFQGNHALSEAQRGWFQKQPMWNVVSAFGKGFADTIDKEAPLDKETIDSLNKSGTLEEFQKFGNISNQSIMDAYIVPYANNIYKSWSFMANAFSDNFAAGTLQIGKAAFVATPEALIAGSKAALEEFDKQDGGTLGATVITTVQAANEASAFGGFLNAAGVIGAETGFARALGMAGRDIPPLPPEVAAAKAAGAMESEGVFTGAKEPTPEQAKAMQDAANMYPNAYAAYHDEAPAAPKAEGAPEAPKTIHDVAREVDPVTFSQYDALRVRQDSYRQWYSDLRDKRAAEAEVAAPHADEIADLRDQLANNPGNARQAARKQAALDRLVQDRQDFIEAAKKVETPDMATIRKALQNTDYGVRDLATRVGAAYREAETRMPPSEEAAEAAPSAEVASGKTPPVASGFVRMYHGGIPGEGARWVTQDVEYARGYAGKSEGGKISYVDLPEDSPYLVKSFDDSGTNMKSPYNHVELPADITKNFKEFTADEIEKETKEKPSPVKPANIEPTSITDKVSRDLVAAGRPQEEAEAHAALIDAHYQARSERFGGKLGTAEEMYEKDAAEVRAGQAKLGKTEGKELAQAEEKTNTPKFKKWFGNSKVVGTDGKPLIVYHGGTSDIEAFNSTRPARGANDYSPNGIYFTKDPSYAGMYAEGDKANITPAYIKMENPKVIDDAGFWEKIKAAVTGEKIKSGAVELTKEEISDLKSQGYDGLINNPGNEIIAFEPSQVKSAFNKGEFDATNPNILLQKARGKIRLATDNAKATITLFKDANASTFIHETGHHWLDELLRDAGRAEAPADLIKDSETVKKWLGVGDDGKLTTAMHEKFARGFERYMMEGTAPSRALDGVFAKFKDWLTSIYQTVQKLRSPINDDIRDVMDRLLTNKPEKAVIAPEIPATKVPPMPELPLEAAAKEPLPPDHPDAPYVKPPPPAPLPVSKTPFKNPLLKWLADMGGVKIGSDVDQALRELGIAPGQKGTPVGFFKKKTETAASIDNIPVREFNDKFDTHYPDTDTGYMNRQDVVDAIRDEAFGKKLGSEYEKTAAEVEAGRAADLKNEVFDHAKGMGVEGLTNGDVDAIAKVAGEGGDLKAAIFNRLEETGKLTDALSEEKRAHEATQFAEYLAEQHGIHIDDDVNSRLFEDAENEYRPGEDQEDAGRPNANDAQPQGPAGNGGGQAGVSKSPQQGERGAGASLFSDAEGDTGDAAKSAAARDADAKRDSAAFTSRPDTHWVDPAGNIRVENLTSEEDVREAMRSVARDNNEFMEARRGVVTDDEVNRLAADMGVGANEINIQKLRQMSLEDGIPMAVRIKAGRMMLKEIATAAVNAMAKYAATGLDADLLALEEIRSRHFTVANTVAAVTAEWGRAGRAFRDISEAQKESEEAIGELFQRMTGQTPARIRRMAKLGAGLDDAGKVSKFLNDSIKPSFGAWITEYWTNGLISGIATHTTYMVGNELLALWKAIPETLAASAIGKIHEALGHEVSGIRAGEVGAQLKARVASIPGALSAAGTAAKTGVTTLLPGENLATTDAALFPAGGAGLAERSGNAHVAWKELGADMWGTIRGLRDSIVATGQLIKAGGVEGAPTFETRPSSLGAIPDIAIKGVQIPVGNIARIPSRAVAAIHSYFRFSDYSMTKAAIAYRTAASEGLAGEAFAARVADGMVNPSHEVMQKSIGTATDLTLMGRGGAVTKAISRFTNLSVNLPGLGETKLLKFVDPFVSISSNILNESLVKRTPAGLLSSAVRDDLLGKNGAVARDEAQARMVVGTTFAITIGGLAAEGLVSGSGPSDPRQNAAWRMLGGNQPHSVRIGDIWYDTHRLGPLGMLIGVGADLHEVSDKISKGDATAASSALMFAVAQNVLDESWMRGPSELIRALTDHERYGDAYVRNFVSSFVPMSVGMSQMARAHDPYARQARTVMDAVKNKIYGLSEDLYPRRDTWGEPIANKDVLGAEGFSAIYEQRVSHDPVNQALLKVGMFPSQPQRKIRGIELNDQQYDDYSRISGRLMKQRLNNIVAQEGFASIPDAQKIQVIKKIMDASRETARKVIMMKNPEIMRQAVQKKYKSVQR